ncbi:MAG TPA: hypothetical protein VEL76_02415 [Gemmataceae bacterium]|nr:hypothetical protein [Gemmataceae bacterium]
MAGSQGISGPSDDEVRCTSRTRRNNPGDSRRQVLRLHVASGGLSSFLRGDELLGERHGLCVLKGCRDTDLTLFHRSTLPAALPWPWPQERQRTYR